VATSVISVTEPHVIPTKATDRDESERSLVQRAQSGDEQSFATLFQLHRKRVHSVCLRMTKDMAEAEDLTQEAFLQVFRRVGSFRCDCAFSTWVYRIAVNTVLMKLRRRKAPPLSLDEPVSSESGSLRRDIGRTDLRLSGAIDRIALRRALQELSKGCRKIFMLHEVQGYQHHEIAKMLDCSIGNSKSQLHKAKMKLRKLLFPKRRRWQGCVETGPLPQVAQSRRWGIESPSPMRGRGYCVPAALGRLHGVRRSRSPLVPPAEDSSSGAQVAAPCRLR
jgi:RNA polymerase sigma-70 factor (ECF subfamily)